MKSRLAHNASPFDESDQVEDAIQSVRDLTTLSLSVSDERAAQFGLVLRTWSCRETVRDQVRYLTDPNSVAESQSSAAVRLANELAVFQTCVAKIRSSLALASDFSSRCRQLFDIAIELFGRAPTWVCFYREVLSTEGLLHVMFPSQEDQAKFRVTAEFDHMQQMLTALRSRDMPENDPNDPQRMITVRLPRSLHHAVCEEAAQLGISVNKLLVSRLLQVLDRGVVPVTQTECK